MLQDKVNLVVCPYCGKVKQFKEFEQILIPVSFFLFHLAQRRITQIHITYEICPSCKRCYQCKD